MTISPTAVQYIIRQYKTVPYVINTNIPINIHVTINKHTIIAIYKRDGIITFPRGILGQSTYKADFRIDRETNKIYLRTQYAFYPIQYDRPAVVDEPDDEFIDVEDYCADIKDINDRCVVS